MAEYGSSDDSYWSSSIDLFYGEALPKNDEQTECVWIRNNNMNIDR